MNSFQIISLLTKALSDFSIVQELVELYSLLVSEKYQKIISEQSELKELLEKLKTKLL